MTLPATETLVVDGQTLEYRLTGSATRTVLILHGGHMSAGSRFGEEIYDTAGWSVLVVSRPGYGRTVHGAGPSNPEFAVRLAGLVRRLGADVQAAVGISLGARTAMTMAALYPDLVRRLVLLCPVSFAPWPGQRSRAISRVVFRPHVEAATWGAVHRALRRDPDRALRRLIGDLTTLDGADAVERLGADRDAMVNFLLSCSSGRGFMADLEPPTDVTTDVGCPALIVGTRNDGSVSFDHAERLASTLPSAQLVELDAPSHILWLGDGRPALDASLRAFLT